MKHMVLLSRVNSELEILTTHWEGRYEVFVTPSNGGTEALSALKGLGDGEMVLAVKDWSEADAQLLIPYLKVNSNIKLVYQSDDALNRDWIIDLAGRQFPVGSFFDLSQMKTAFQELGIKECHVSEEYSKVRLYQFFQFNFAVCDIFLRINTSKYVKIIHKDEVFTKEILKSYESKTRYLYIKSEDLSSYLHEVSQTLQELHKTIKNEDLLHQLQVASLENVRQSLHSLGIDEAAAQLAHTMVDSVMHSVEKNKRIWDVLGKTFTTNNYLSEHSIAIGVLSTAISNGISWGSEFIQNKLIFAALFHDVGLSDPTLASIDHLTDDAFSHLSEEQKKEITQHMYQSIEMLKSIGEIPANVDTIILEHHERPNGSGFPRHLTSNNITPLSAIFIVAEEFYGKLSRMGFSVENRNKVLQEMGVEFSSGNFKLALNALINLFV